MPRLTFPFGPNGLLVPALVGLTGADLEAVRAAGLASPGFLHVRAMIDTGATVTAVVPGVLSRMNVPPGPAVQTTTAAGAAQVRLYQVGFTIYDLVSGVRLIRTDWTVTNLLHNLDDVDVLFGLDLLREIVLTVSGPGQTFSLDF
jgi:hypothetical protein